MSHAKHAEQIYGAVEPGSIEPPAPIPFRPAGDRIVVKQNALDPMTVGGVIKRPDRESDWTAFGVVVAVGPGERNKLGERIPLTLKVGDQVVYDFRRGREEREVQHICGPRMVILHEHEVAAVIDADDTCEHPALTRCTSCATVICSDCIEPVLEHRFASSYMRESGATCMPCRVATEDVDDTNRFKRESDWTARDAAGVPDGGPA
jgi:chaperonin GroES